MDPLKALVMAVSTCTSLMAFGALIWIWEEADLAESEQLVYTGLVGLFSVCMVGGVASA